MVFTRMYAPIEFEEQQMIMEHIGQTGRDALEAVDLLRAAPRKYTSTVEYEANPLAQNLRDIAQVHTAGLGTRIFYAQHGGYDVHGNQVQTQQKLWRQVSRAVRDFLRRPSMPRCGG